MMKCEICDTIISKYFRCKLCGRIVCSDDYIHNKKICVVCYETLCEICKSQLSIGYCKYCGKLVCRDCSVDEGAALICYNCKARQK